MCDIVVSLIVQIERNDHGGSNCSGAENEYETYSKCYDIVYPSFLKKNLPIGSDVTNIIEKNRGKISQLVPRKINFAGSGYCGNENPEVHKMNCHEERRTLLKAIIVSSGDRVVLPYKPRVFRFRNNRN